MTVRIVSKNSSAEDKRPTPSQLANGEIAVNLHEAGAFLTIKDTAGNIQQVGGVKISSNSPGSPVKGTLWVDSDTSRLFIYDGNNWLSVTGAGGGGGGGGTVTIIAGDAINVTETGGDTFEIDVALQDNTGRTGGNGLEFAGGNNELRGRLASSTELGVIRVDGATINVDANGIISVDDAISGGLNFKGSLDITTGSPDAEPVTRAVGDFYTSEAAGTLAGGGDTTDWQDLTEGTDTTTAVGDLIICQDAAGGSDNWVLVGTGGQTLWTDEGTFIRPTDNANEVRVPALADGNEATTGTSMAMLDDNGQFVRADPKGGLEIDNGQIQIDADGIPLPGGGDGNGDFGFWQRDNGTDTVRPRTAGDQVTVNAADNTANITLAANGNITSTAVGNGDDVTTGTGILMSTDAGLIVRAQPKGGIEIDSGQIQVDADQIPLPGGGDGNGDFGFWSRDDATNTLSPRTANDNLDQGSGTITSTGAVTGGSLTASTGDATVTAGNLTVTAGNATVGGNVTLSTAGADLVFNGTDDTPTARTISVQAPTGAAGFGANYTLTLPTTDGNANELLQTDGSGVLSWAAAGATVSIGDTPPASPDQGDLWWNSDDGRLYVWYEETGGSDQWVDASPDGAQQLWELNGNVISPVNDAHNVSIGGAASPTHPLTVQTNGTSTTAGDNIAARFQANGANRDVTLQLSDNDSHSATISMVEDETVFAQAGTESMRIDDGRRLLIGATSATSSRLHVAGGSLSVTGSDAGFNADGNRAFMDVSAGTARMGACHGGGTAMALDFFAGSSTRVGGFSNGGIFDALAQQSLTGNGFTRLPGGIFIQWGTNQANTAGIDANFPIAFPTACWMIVGSLNNQVNPAGAECSVLSTTQFRLKVQSGSPQVHWIAMGV